MDQQLGLSSPSPIFEPRGKTVEIVVDGERLCFAWGEIHELGTSAYWTEQTRRLGVPPSYRLGETLAEEVAACILGGHGIPAEIGLAAFANLREADLLRPAADPEAIAACLREPLLIPGRPRPVRYRFAAQRAARVSAALAILDAEPAPKKPFALRDFLLAFPGIGPKTASWVVRNWTGCDGVAIIDIHVQRAGICAGFFSPCWHLPRDYALFEQAFCEVARIGDVTTAALDACVWDQMQALGRAQIVLLGTGSQQAA
jgi:thermostable 8-oxoguanine DNA glycosylase